MRFAGLMARAARWLGLGAAVLALAACGGGGSGCVDVFGGNACGDAGGGGGGTPVQALTLNLQLLDGDGKVTTASGELLDPPLALPPQFRGLRIETNGEVSVIRDYTDEELAALDEFAARDGVREVVGTIELARFSNPAGLESIGNSRYRETAESQPPINGVPGQDGMGVVFSGWLEASNVDIATEMTGLVMAKRGYQLNLVAFRTIEEMLTQANDVTV